MARSARVALGLALALSGCEPDAASSGEHTEPPSTRGFEGDEAQGDSPADGLDVWASGSGTPLAVPDAGVGATTACEPPGSGPRARGEVTVVPRPAVGSDPEDIPESRRGPGAELCPEDAPDADGDRLCDAAEAHYQTDPSESDTDGDALSDFMELFAVEVPGDTPRWLDLARYGAHPRHRDVFVEVDYYAAQKPSVEALNMVVEAFAAAPLDNPDGSRGVALHVALDAAPIAKSDEDDVFGVPGSKDRTSADVWKDVDVIKDKYLDPARRPAFHYSLWGRQIRNTGMSGLARDIPARDFIVTFVDYKFNTMEAAGTFMHELGHDLGLMHGGSVNWNDLPNYFSVMNYTYQFNGVFRCGRSELDYSRHQVAAIDEAALSEPNAMSPGPGSSEDDLARYGVALCTERGKDNCTYQLIKKGNASANLDWNRNNTISKAPYALDLDKDGYIGTLPPSVADWGRLVFHGGGRIGAPGPVAAYDLDEPGIVAPCRSL